MDKAVKCTDCRYLTLGEPQGDGYHEGTCRVRLPDRADRLIRHGAAGCVLFRWRGIPEGAHPDITLAVDFGRGAHGAVTFGGSPVGWLPAKARIGKLEAYAIHDAFKRRGDALPIEAVEVLLLEVGG